MAIAQTILIADEVALPQRGEMLDLQDAAAFLPPPRTRPLVSSDTDISVVTDIPGETRLNLLVPQRNVALLRPVDSTPTSHKRHRMEAHSMVTMRIGIVLFAMSIASSSSAAAASRVLGTSSSSSSTAGTPTATAPLCGSACSAQDELKLREAFLNEVKAHGYQDAACRSHLKAYICAVCLPPASAPASEPLSNTTAGTTNNSSLPLPCATPSSVSNHDLTSSSRSSTQPPPPTPDDWLPADDDSKAPTTPKWLIALLASALPVLLGGFAACKVFKARLGCCTNNNHCCTNINCCILLCFV